MRWEARRSFRHEFGVFVAIRADSPSFVMPSRREAENGHSEDIYVVKEVIIPMYRIDKLKGPKRILRIWKGRVSG